MAAACRREVKASENMVAQATIKRNTQSKYNGECSRKVSTYGAKISYANFLSEKTTENEIHRHPVYPSVFSIRLEEKTAYTLLRMLKLYK